MCEGYFPQWVSIICLLLSALAIISGSAWGSWSEFKDSRHETIFKRTIDGCIGALFGVFVGVMCIAAGSALGAAVLFLISLGVC